MTTFKTREECKEAVSHPGSFEGEAVYVPYYWALAMEGLADRDDGTTCGFDIKPEDRVLFPELRDRHTVKLTQTEQGFIVEI